MNIRGSGGINSPSPNPEGDPWWVAALRGMASSIRGSRGWRKCDVNQCFGE
jgi:hypothetical protein